VWFAHLDIHTSFARGYTRARMSSTQDEQPQHESQLIKRLSLDMSLSMEFPPLQNDTIIRAARGFSFLSHQLLSVLDEL
jgi:hypothetical protein